MILSRSVNRTVHSNRDLLRKISARHSHKTTNWNGNDDIIGMWLLKCCNSIVKLSVQLLNKPE